MTTAFARPRARAGVPSLRLDLRGIGDSDGDPFEDETPHEYDAAWYGRPGFLGDIREALAWLSAERSARRFAFVGLCSGATLGFQTAIADERVIGAALLNRRAYAVCEPGRAAARADKGIEQASSDDGEPRNEPDPGLGVSGRQYDESSAEKQHFSTGGVMEQARIRVNAPQVIHESIDGEVIIINLASGNYYSLNGSGADVWDVIQQSPGVSASELVDALALRFSDAPVDLEGPVSRFLEALREEGLIAGADGAERVAFSPGADWARPGDKQRFVEPSIEKFTDMQDLVLLDPVHEVDATGWPQARPDDAPVSSPGA